MKNLIFTLLALVGISQAQIVTVAGRTQWGDSLRWGDTDDSTGYLRIRGQTKHRDSAGTWRALSGADSCSRPLRLGFSTLPNSKLEVTYEVRTSSGNTDSSQVKFKVDSRYCPTDSTKCESWVSAGRFRGDTSSFVMDSLISIATTSGTTWKPSRQLLDVPGGNQIRFCVDGFKTGTSATDTTFFRRFVVRSSSVPAGGIPPSAVSISGVSLGTVDVSSSALPTGAATSANQTNGNQVTQLVDSAGSKIGSTSHAINAYITGGSSSGAVAQGSTTSGQTGGLTQAAVTTAAPSYTTGQTSPLSLTTGGALRVDASAAAIAASQSGTWTVQPGNTANTTAWKVDASSVAVPVTDNSGSLTVDNAGTFAVQAAQSGTWNVTNVSGTVSLPTGAATAAKQPALGTAGSPSTDVISVQGVASGTAMPISAASLPLPSTAATSTKQSDGTQKTQIVDGSGNVIASTSNNLNVQCANCSGSGASAADGATFTAGSSVFAPSGLFYQTTATSNPLTNGQQGMAQGTAYHALHVNLRDANGAEVSVGGGTQYDEDAAETAGAKLTMAGAVRRDTPASSATTDGDNATLNTSSTGRLWTSSTIDAALPAGTNAIGKLAANSGVDIGDVSIDDGGNSITVDYATTGSGTATGALRVELPTNGTGVIATVGAVTAITNALPAGTNAIGKLAANSGVDIGDVDVTSVSGTVTVAGPAAHDAAVSGNPLLAGAEARTSNGTAVANGDVTRLQATIEGKLVTKPHSVYGATWTYAAASGGITNTTAATMKAAAGAGVRVCLTGIQVINGHATVSTEVSVKDGAGGTVLHRGFAQAAGGGYAANFDVPICGSANTLMEVVPVTTGSAIYVNAQGYTSAE